MSTLKNFLAAAVVLGRLSQTSACSCAPPGSLCDSILSADVVLHVKPLTRVDGPSINDDTVYTLETIQVFKGEEPGPNEYDEAGATFEMVTGGNSALCGVNMFADGTEYLIDINRQSDGSLYAAGICGLFRVWTEEDRPTLEEGCDDYDPCDGECGELQECVRSFDYYAEDAYYCQDTCDPSPCLDGEACTLVIPQCSEIPCIPEAVCGGETEGPAPLPTLPPLEYVDSTTSYAETLAPSDDDDSTTPPAEGDERNNDDESATPTPAPGTGGPPSSAAPRTAAPTLDETGPPAPVPTSPPGGDVPTGPNSSQAPTASPTAADGSRDVAITGAPSTASSAPDGGGAAPLPGASSAPTVSANSEGGGTDTGAAPAVRSSGGAVAATAVAVATAAAAACASL